MRTTVVEAHPFRELLQHVRSTVLEALEHQDYPLSLLVERLQPVRDPGRSPLFQVFFAFERAQQLDQAPLFVQGQQTAVVELGELAFERYALEVEFVQFDLAFMAEETEEFITGSLQYNTDLFHPKRIERMVGHFLVLLDAICAAPETPIRLLPLLSAQEQQQLSQWNETAVDYPTEVCLHTLVTRQVERSPNDIAVLFEGESLTYAELNERADRLADHLISLGIKADQRVGLFLERSLDLPVSILAILKAGGAYVPLDPAYPAARVAYMLTDARVSVLLTHEHMVAHLPQHTAKVVCLDTTWPRLTRTSAREPVSSVTPDNLAYVMYTSGSTGQPKGVAMTHRALVNLITWQISQPTAVAQARTLQFSPPGFDVSCQEMFATWGAGGVLILVSEEVRRDSTALLGWLDAMHVERLFLPFVALQQLALAADTNSRFPQSLREIITAGEQLQITEFIAQLITQLDHGRLYNQYGPTESHVVTAYSLDGDIGAWQMLPPIGFPIANTQIYLLNSALQRVPIGVPGELYIGGCALARGYLNRPALTAECFLPDPFSAVAGARIYRTGDLACYLPDGSIAYLGRSDQQTKVRGFRIEPSEIEHVLKQHPQVLEAIVLVDTDHAGLQRLVAYLVPIDSPSEAVNVPTDLPSSDEMRTFLKQQLPEYMIPSFFFRLKSVPLTPSGKVDRRAVAGQDREQLDDSRVYVAPGSPAEEQLATIWAEVLGVSSIGIHDNFFYLGGTRCLRLVSRRV